MSDSRELHALEFALKKVVGTWHRSTTFAAAGLRDGDTYQVTVASIAGTIQGEPSQPAMIVRLTLGTPQIRQARYDESTKKIIIRWNLVPLATGYLVTAQETSTRRPPTPIAVLTNTAIIDASGFPLGSTYEIKVRATAELSTSDASPPQVVRISQAAPPPPPPPPPPPSPPSNASRNVTVSSTVKWGGTGVSLNSGDNVTIAFVRGTWTANPSTGMVGPAGNSSLRAKSGYALPGAPEGALIGRIGPKGTAFRVQIDQSFKATNAGELQLTINDDLNNQYGAGYGDNHGSLDLTITWDD